MLPPDRSLVAIGGGSGLPVLLRGLKHRVAGRDQLTAVVTMADDGGSSGRLRRDFGMLPPGDIRNCLAAVADDSDLLTRLFQYRFPSGEGLSGHSFGNLFLTALTGITGDFYQAVLTAETVLSVKARILPATLESVRLAATGASGRRYDGESAIGRSGERLLRVELEPLDAPAFAPAVAAIERASLVVLGPGSLYTSLLPNLLIPGIRDALRRSEAPLVLALNLMTQPGETERMDAAEHLRAIRDLAGDGLVDVVLVNDRRPPARLLERYAAEGAALLVADPASLPQVEPEIEIVATDLLDEAEAEAEGGRPAFIRHDPAKLADAVLALAAGFAGGR